MIYKLNEIDSNIIGQNFLDILDYNIEDDFLSFEKEYLKKYEPLYVLCKVPSDDILKINKLCSFGFSYIEFQMSYYHDTYDYSDELNSLKISSKEVKDEEPLKKVIGIAGKTFKVDRIYIDSDLKSMFDENISSKRYKSYIENSYYMQDQCVYVLSIDNGSIAGFYSMYYPEDREENAVLYLIGLDEKYKGYGYGEYAVKSYITESFKRGYKGVVSNLSGINTAMINTEINKCKGKVTGSSVVLRKIYKDNYKK